MNLQISLNPWASGQIVFGQRFPRKNPNDFDVLGKWAAVGKKAAQKGVWMDND